MKKLKWFLLASLIPLFLPVLIIIILMGAVGGGGDEWLAPIPKWVTYADHWSDGNPYTHNLLVRHFSIYNRAIRRLFRYVEVSYDKNKVMGKKLLEWEAKSNLLMSVESIAIT